MNLNFDKYLDPPEEPTHWECDGCHEIFDGGDMTKEDGRGYCQDCLDALPAPEDWREQLHARDIALAAKQQTITAMAARIAALEQENGRQRAVIVDLESRIREYQE